MPCPHLLALLSLFSDSMAHMDRTLVSVYAEEMIRLQDTALLTQPLSTCVTEFAIDDAYAVALEVMRRRERSSWRRAGRKIGFTNTSIWQHYAVDRPMFGYMYQQTVTYTDTGKSPPSPKSERGPGGEVRSNQNLPNLPMGEGTGEGDANQTQKPMPWVSTHGAGNQPVLSLSGLVQPLIEPEICLKLKAPLPPSGDPVDLLGAVDWIGHGFEVVQCHFPDWKFAIEDTIADSGLHGRYVVGPVLPIENGREPELARRLATFTITLSKDGHAMAAGGGANVLGSPLRALAHLAVLLTTLPDHPPLQPGELITTGTLTDALPISPGETWSTQIEGLGLAGIELRLV
jgi:2-keto-4-pentenoate hydratase